MNITQAITISRDYILKNNANFDRIEVCGSIRREKPEVNDIDIVAIPKFDVGKKKINRFDYNGIQIDIYYATNQNFDVLKLIRTGSAEHNKMLCITALRKGWKLHADGRGLMRGEELIDNTEKGILEKLLGKYVEPKDREFHVVKLGEIK